MLRNHAAGQFRVGRTARRSSGDFWAKGGLSGLHAGDVGGILQDVVYGYEA